MDNNLELVKSIELKARTKEQKSPLIHELPVSESIQGKLSTLKPLPLQRELPPPNPFPVDALGDVLASLTYKISEVVQAPQAICGQSLLAAAALLVQGHANVIIDGRVVPIAEFFLTVGATGERKSAVDNIALSPHRAYQERLRTQYESEQADWKLKVEVYESIKKRLLNKTNSLAEKDKIIKEIGYPPTKSLFPLILAEEPTYEGLIKLLIEGQPSMGLFSDEGGRFIGGYGMNDGNLLKTAAGLCGLWDGKSVTRVRAGDSSALLVGKRLSFHLMAQPNVAQIMLSNKILSEQGLLSRCLVTWPLSTAGTRFYREIDLTNSPEFKKYELLAGKILQTCLPIANGKQNELSPRKISLSHEAKELYILFHNDVEKEIGDSGRFNSIRGFGNKAPEHALRLAGIVALFQDIQAIEIDLVAMKRGIELAEYYLSEVLRLHNSNSIDADLSQAEKLLGWLKNRNSKEIKLVDVYQSGPAFVRNANKARNLMHVLEEHYWVIPVEEFSSRVNRKEKWKLTT